MSVEQSNSWPEIIDYDLLLAKACIDDRLRAVPLHVPEDWSVLSLQDLLGGGFPPDEFNYVFLITAVEPDHPAADTDARPGIVVMTASQQAVYQAGSHRLLNTPATNPQTHNVFLTINVKETMGRFSGLKPPDDLVEHLIPVLFVEQQESISRFVLDMAAIQRMSSSEQEKFMEFALPLMQSVLPDIAARN